MTIEFLLVYNQPFFKGLETEMKTWSLKGDLSRCFAKGLEKKVKTWILKSDLSHSPQAALRMYACGRIKLKSNIKPIISSATKTKHSFLISRIKSQLKMLSKKIFNQEPAAGMEDS